VYVALKTVFHVTGFKVLIQAQLNIAFLTNISCIFSVMLATCHSHPSAVDIFPETGTFQMRGDVFCHVTSYLVFTIG
jgi:hypothetical protein